MRLLTAGIVAICMATSAFAQNIDGAWSGDINAGFSKIKLILNFAKDATGNDICTLDSPNQGAKGIKTVINLLSADSLNISVPMIGASYAANIADNEISGIFVQSGLKMPLTLKRGVAKANRPQTPSAPFAYTTEEVTFYNTDDNASLCGTLTYPVDYHADKPVPVVLMVTGSGLQNRDEEVFEHKPFSVIADYFAHNGIATLRYDDRSKGKSKGDVTNATTLNFAKDATAGIAFLKSKAKWSKIGVLGHSEGGTIAFVLGAGKQVDFIISLAGTGVRGDSILIEQNRKMLLLNGISESVCNDYCKMLTAIYDFKIANKQAVDATTEVNKLAAKLNIHLPSPMLDNLAAILTGNNAWLNYFMAYNPANNIKAVTCPVMALNGALDTQVIASTNLGAIRQLLPPNKQSVIREYPSLNHLFQHCTTGLVAEYSNIEETFSPEVLHDMTLWINSLRQSK